MGLSTLAVLASIDYVTNKRWESGALSERLQIVVHDPCLLSSAEPLWASAEGLTPRRTRYKQF